MIFYIKGKVTSFYNEKVVLENNNIGYEILVSNLDRFTINEEVTVYIYEHKHELESYYVGFLSLEEKEMFLLLISVSGLGVKTAINMLNKYKVSEITSAIQNDDISLLKKAPGVGNRLAQQILLDLKNKVLFKKKTNTNVNDIRQVLLDMGFSKKEVDGAILMCSFTGNNLEENIKEALIKIR